MAKTKRKPAYDMANARDREVVAAAKEAGLSTKHRIPQRREEALLSLTPEQRKHGRLDALVFRPTREMDGESETVASPIQRCTLPRCLWALPSAARDAVEEYAAIFHAAIPSETVHIGERSGGGGVADSPYDHAALERYGALKRQVGKKASKALEWAARLPDDALVSTAQWHGLIQAGMIAHEAMD